MNASLPAIASVLELFAFLFSNRWVRQWQKRAAPAASGPKQPKKGKGSRQPSRFYERIFTLRVTLWYLIFQRLSFDPTLAAVVSAAQGPTARSEQRLAWQIMARAAAWVIWVADRNFGVWSVVAQAVRFDQGVLFRLTAARAKKLTGGRPLRCIGLAQRLGAQSAVLEKHPARGSQVVGRSPDAVPPSKKSSTGQSTSHGSLSSQALANPQRQPTGRAKTLDRERQIRVILG